MAMQVNMARVARLLVLTMLLTFIHAFQSPFSYAAEPDASVPSSDIQGLKAEYYTSSGPSAFNFGTLKSTVIDPQINFSNLDPIFNTLVGQSDNVNVRWTGKIVPAYSENYTFSIIGDNGFRLWVNNKLIIDHWVNDWDKEQTAQPIALQAGVKYDFKIEYFENTGGSNLYLRWASPSVPKQIVPKEAFFLPDGFAFDGPLSGAIAESGLTAELQFGYPLHALPAGIKDSLHISVSGMNWPIDSIALKEGDSSVIQLTFHDPVYSKDAQLVHVRYDGNGGLQSADGRAIASFANSISNFSKFQITTPWADKVDPDNVLPEYPRPQLERTDWLNLNGEWEFQAAEQGDTLPTGKTLQEKILVPFAAESKLSGIQRVEDLMWYKRSFTLPDNWNGKHVKLNFGAVDYLATVYVNGQKVGDHKGGYTSFAFDITDYLVPGTNELIVHVLDKTDAGEDQVLGKQTVKKLGGIWYTSISGIWQTVWLEPVAQSHIEKLDMKTDIHAGKLLLTPVVAGGNGVKVEAVAKSGDTVVGSATGHAGEELAISIPNAHLWSPDDPFLYDLEVKVLGEGDAVVDKVESYFGMREISVGQVDGKQRILLNGDFVFQMGPLDQGYYPDGLYTAPTEEALKYDIQTVKRLDMNMIRKHIKVEPARWYYWADKLGVLVWQDMPSLEDRQNNQGRDITQATKDQWMKEYKEMIDQLRSVPSIIVWTVFNEGWGQWDWGGQQTRDAVNKVKAYDPTRLVNNASGWQDSGAGDLIDYHSYPGPNSPVPSSTRAAVLGEYGGLGLHVPGHEWSPLVFSYQLMSSKQELTDRYIQFINQLKQFKNNQGLSAAVYTQITDVEYEINGLLSYDRKVEKLDFDAVAKAHRELIGSASKADLQTAIAAAEAQAKTLAIGNGPGQYTQAVYDAYTAVINEAKAVSAADQPGSKAIEGAISKLTAARAQLFASVNDPVSSQAQKDSFDGAALDSAWSIYRNDTSKWSLTANPGSLTLQTLAGDSFEGTNAIKNVFLKQAPTGDFSVTLKVTAPVNKNYQQAGLFIWSNEDNYVRLGHVWDTTGSTGKALETAYEKSGVYKKATNMKAHPGYDTAYLKLTKIGNTYTSYYWNGTAWVQAADPMQVDLGSELKVGLYAMSATDGTSIPARFDYFAVAAEPQEQEAAEVAAGLTSIAAPALGDAQLTLPAVPAGFTVAINSSSNEAVVAKDGTITAPAADTAVNLVLTVTRTSDGSTANTSPIAVLIPGQPVEPTGPAGTLTGPASAVHGGAIDVEVGAQGVESSFMTLDLLVNYDPSKVSFATAPNEDGEKTTYSLADDAITELHSGFRVVGTGVKPEEGTIRIIMASEGTNNAITADGPLLKLHGTVKSGAETGTTDITLGRFDVSKDGDLTSYDTSSALHIEIGAVDRTALAQAIASAQAVHNAAVAGTEPGQYPAAAKAALQTAINTAQSVYDNAGATEAELASAITALTQAIQTFQASVIPSQPGDKAALRDAIAKAQAKWSKAVEGTKVGQYAAGAKAALEAAINAANAVNNSAGASQSTINQAVTALNQAVTQFASRLITLVEGETQVSIRDLSVLAAYYGITSEDAAWNKVKAADIFDEGAITIRSIAAIAQMIIDEWYAE